MTIPRFPPPPQFAGDTLLNRWLLQVWDVLNTSGGGVSAGKVVTEDGQTVQAVIDAIEPADFAPVIALISGLAGRVAGLPDGTATTDMLARLSGLAAVVAGLAGSAASTATDNTAAFADVLARLSAHAAILSALPDSATATADVLARLSAHAAILSALPDSATAAADLTARLSALAALLSTIPDSATATSELTARFSALAATVAGRGLNLDSTIAVGSAVALTSPNAANITSLAIPSAGLWWVEGTVGFNPGAGCNATRYMGAIHTATAAIPTTPSVGGIFDYQLAFGVNSQTISCGGRFIFATAAMTVYLNALAVFAGGTNAAFGNIHAFKLR